jgi:hypothetical protein
MARARLVSAVGGNRPAKMVTTNQRRCHQRQDIHSPTRAQLAGQTNIRWRANALQHAVLIGRGRRQGLGSSEHADPAGRAAALAAANRRVRHAKHLTCIEDAKTVGDVDPLPARISDARDALATLPTASDRACDENAGRHAQQCPNDAPGNCVENGTRSGQNSRGERACEQAWVLLKRRAQLALAGNKPEKRKDGKQNSRCVKVGLRGFVPMDAASTKTGGRCTHVPKRRTGARFARRR